jgi:hypothetical protein
MIRLPLERSNKIAISILQRFFSERSGKKEIVVG